MTIKLKDDIYWTDGEPFTSYDVKARFYICGAMQVWAGTWGYIESLETPDDKTVIFRFKEDIPPIIKVYIIQETQNTPYHIFKKWMPQAEELIEMIKDGTALVSGSEKTDEFKKIWSEYRKDVLEFSPEMPIGNTPFKIELFSPSDIVFEKVKDYPGADKVCI